MSYRHCVFKMFSFWKGATERNEQPVSMHSKGDGQAVCMPSICFHTYKHFASCHSQDQPNHCVQTAKEIFSAILQEVQKKQRKIQTTTVLHLLTRMFGVGLRNNRVHQAAAHRDRHWGCKWDLHSTAAHHGPFTPCENLELMGQSEPEQTQLVICVTLLGNQTTDLKSSGCQR